MPLAGLSAPEPQVGRPPNKPVASALPGAGLGHVEARLPVGQGFGG